MSRKRNRDDGSSCAEDRQQEDGVEIIDRKQLDKRIDDTRQKQRWIRAARREAQAARGDRRSSWSSHITSLEALRDVHPRNCRCWNRRTAETANANAGHMSFMEVAVTHRCPLPKDAADIAAKNGHTEVLRFCLQRGWRTSLAGRAQAAIRGHHDALILLRQRVDDEQVWPAWVCALVLDTKCALNLAERVQHERLPGACKTCWDTVFKLVQNYALESQPRRDRKLPTDLARLVCQFVATCVQPVGTFEEGGEVPIISLE